ncbi:DOPA 4,5-dioxygenase family protein [Sphingomonas sp. NSE70-1]|uniref:DOPA 4,5-dioxygenase family protein n=1 Tax=Sphingomonas caseinilyticus TaxID=2908205 RepID=A0ABT0RWE2_9SPHN|nr:DOPA 4,5-dioxygenase family protein [Sphingomonas caseinilyticus]MCL6699342.1 DOPA 4,5-dioxygenase family protein [Sphingomonas caseinilyticus]
MTGAAPFHAHIYYSDAERPVAEALRAKFQQRLSIEGDGRLLFVGAMTDRAVGPHPIPQYEIHFLEAALPSVVEAIEVSGLQALVHPLTDDDLADHTSLARWIGEPIDLDLTVLDPPGMNQGVERFGKADF